MGRYRYEWGFWTFENETLLVRVDDATFQRYLNAYMEAKGIDTRSYSELLRYADSVLSQRVEAAQVLENADYWRDCKDPQVRIYPLPLWRSPRQK